MSSGFAKSSIGYLVGNLLIKGIGFLTLPIFSRVLDTYDFGIYNVFIAYDAILFVVIGFALHSSLRSANWEFPGKIDEYVSSVSLIYLGNMFVLILVASLFGSQISELMGLDTVVVVCLIIHSMGTAIVVLYNNRISLQYSYRKYMAVAAASSVGNVLLSLVLVFTIFHGRRYLGRILGATIALAIVGVIVLVGFWRKARPRFNFQWWKYGIGYSLPIVFHGLSQVTLGQIGRLMINYMVSTTAAGIYGLVANLQIILAVLTDSISTVWSTWFYEVMEGESADQATGPKMFDCNELKNRHVSIQMRADQLVDLFAIVTMCVLAFIPEIVWLLGGSAYMEGMFCAFGMVLSGFCVFVYNLVVVGEYYRQKTHYIMWATMVVAVMNIVLNIWVINEFGYVAAAYATLFSYGCYAAFHWFISYKLMGFFIVRASSIGKSCFVLALSALVSAACVDHVAVRIIVNLALCLALSLPLCKRMGGIYGLRSLLGR